MAWAAVAKARAIVRESMNTAPPRPPHAPRLSGTFTIRCQSKHYADTLLSVSEAAPVRGQEQYRPAELAPTGANQLALAAAGITVFLWASAFVAIRSAGHHFSPGAMALGRLLCGCVLLGLVFWARREAVPPRAAWPGIVISVVLRFGVYFVALNWGGRRSTRAPRR
jgi:hypothetical protein